MNILASQWENMGFTLVKYTYEQLYGQRKRSFLYMLFMSILLFLFFVFLGLRVDKLIRWNWIIVFTPFWGTLTFLFFSFPIKSWGKPWELFSFWNDHSLMSSMQFVYKVLMILFGIPIIVFTILLAMKLQYYPQFSLFLVFIPLWMMDCMID